MTVISTRWAFVLGGYLVFLLVLASVVTHDPMAADTANQLAAPSSVHLLGTDLLGRDVLSRFAHGARSTLMMAALATGIAMTAGTGLGLLAASKSPIARISRIMMDSLISVPSLLTALVLISLTGRGAVQVALAVGISQAASAAQMSYTLIRGALAKDFIPASYSLGASGAWILRRHVLPFIRSGLLAYSSVMLGIALMNTAGLCFLGLGPAPGQPEWGMLLAEGRLLVRSAPWVSLAPGIAITLLIWLCNRTADAVSANQP
jgi:peptide/nickel transport system permease protein